MTLCLLWTGSIGVTSLVLVITPLDESTGYHMFFLIGVLADTHRRRIAVHQEGSASPGRRVSSDSVVVADDHGGNLRNHGNYLAAGWE